MLMLNRHSVLPKVIFDRVDQRSFKDKETKERLKKLGEEAYELMQTDQFIVNKYFGYKKSRGIAMNMLFTLQALRKEEETLDFLQSFHTKLTHARGKQTYAQFDKLLTQLRKVNKLDGIPGESS